MNKLLKSQAVGLPETKNNREEHLTNHVGAIYTYVKKAKKLEKIIRSRQVENK